MSPLSGLSGHCDVLSTNWKLNQWHFINLERGLQSPILTTLFRCPAVHRSPLSYLYLYKVFLLYFIHCFPFEESIPGKRLHGMLLFIVVSEVKCNHFAGFMNTFQMKTLLIIVHCKKGHNCNKPWVLYSAWCWAASLVWLWGEVWDRFVRPFSAFASSLDH